MPGFLLLHMGQRRGDAVQHPLQVHIDHPIPLVDLKTLKKRLRHQPGIVDHHVDASVGLYGYLDQCFDLLTARHVRRQRGRLAAIAG